MPVVRNDGASMLDGNAAAGLLGEIFVAEITTAQIQCRECDMTGAVGAVRLFGGPMGTVLRCPGCDNVLMRVVSTPYGRRLEMAGARHLIFPVS